MFENINHGLLKRQFLDWLYDHPRKYSKMFKIKRDSGYHVILSPNELLKEIDGKTDIGLRILEEIETNQENIYIIKNQLKDQEKCSTEK